MGGVNGAAGMPESGPSSLAELTRSLSRTQFLDRWLTAEELRAVAEMWRGWAWLSGLAPRGAYRFECWAWGFVREDGARMAADLGAVLGPGHHVALGDPDTLVITSGWFEVHEPVNVSTWLRLLEFP